MSDANFKKKTQVSCTFLIESLHISNFNDYPYFIKWKFLKEVGSTEHCLPDSTGTIIFNKEFHFVFNLASKQQKKKKYLKIKIYQTFEHEKKIGKLKIAINDFIKKNKIDHQEPVNYIAEKEKNQGTISFQIFSHGEQSPNDKKAKIRRTPLYQRNPNHRRSRSLTNELVSELASISEAHHISQSTMRNAGKTTPERPDIRLEDMCISESYQSKTPDAKNKIISPAFYKTNSNRSIQSLNEFLRTSHHRKARTFTQNDPFSFKQKDEIKIVRKILGSFKKLIDFKDNRTNLAYASFEGYDSLIFAKLLYEKILDELDDNLFQLLMDFLPNNILKSSLLGDLNHTLRNFYIFYGLCALLKKPPSKFNINTERSLTLFNKFQNKLIQLLHIIADDYFQIFDWHVNNFINHKIENEEAVNIFLNTINNIIDDMAPPKEFKSILKYSIISNLDLLLYKSVINMKEITFMDSIPWNSFCTYFRDSIGYDLKLFSESTCIIQMTEKIESNYDEIKAITNDMPPIAILELLKRRIPDEISLRKPPNIKKFAETFNLDDDQEITDHNQLINWSEIITNSFETVDTEKWTDILIPEKVFNNNPEIECYFNQ